MKNARSRGLLLLFLALAALQIAPIWSVKYVPTGDGPSHVYNAWIMHALARGSAPPNIEVAYRIDWWAHPNWTGHAFMALAMFVVPPLVAEKLLLTLIVALVLAGSWMLATAVDPRNDVYAFLAFAFTYPQSLLAGYYNYSLSIGLFLIILAVWWRRREQANASTVAFVAVLLVLSYFTHPMATLLACGSIGLLSLLARRPAHLLSLVPAGLLLLLFGRTPGSGAGQSLDTSIAWDAAYILTRVDFLHVFDSRQRPLSFTISLVYAALIAVTIVMERRRPANGLAIVALLFTLSMFWLPAAAGTRDLFTQRAALFAFLVLPAWFTPQITRRWRVALLCVMSLTATFNAVTQFQRLRFFGHGLEAFVRAFDVIDHDSTLLPLFFTRPRSETLVPLYTHALGYVALEKRLVHLGNYEPASRYFPIANRIEAVDASAVELAPGTIDIPSYAPHAEWIATIDLPLTAQREDLDERYRLVSENQALRIYRRKDPLDTPHELILLPLLGTRNDIGAPHGARWRVEQSITNSATTAVRALFRNCPGDTPCDLHLAAGETQRVASGQSRTGCLLVPRGSMRFIRIRTVVRRADVERPDLSSDIPAVHEDSFARGTLRIRAIATRGHRIALRAYLFSERPWEEVTLHLRATDTGALLGERRFYMTSYSMYENANLDLDFIGFSARAESVDIELLAPPDVRMWAFATALDDAGRSRVHPPSP